MNDQVVESEHNAQTGAEETTKDSNFYDVTKIMKSKAFETKYEKVFLGDCLSNLPEKFFEYDVNRFINDV